tara:strand:+ start:595 stop:744 length:150 start_codon:yes stop_codon:yes gene_type:complete
MKLIKERIKEFQYIYSRNYGVHLSEEKAEKEFIEITQLLKTIIEINHRK